MRKLERILISLFIIGLILQIIPIAGGSLLIVLALSCLAIVYFMGGVLLFQGISLRDLIKGNTSGMMKDFKAIVLSIAAGFFCSVITVGIMFRVQAWPGAALQLGAGLGGMTIVSALAFFMYSDKSKDPLKSILIHTAAWGLVSAFLLVVSPTFFLEIKYRSDQEYVRLMKEVHENPGDSAAEKRLYDYRESMSRSVNGE